MKTTTAAEERSRAVAIHEAGHAVAAVRLNIPISKVTIVPTQTYLGLVEEAEERLAVLLPALIDYFPTDDDDDDETVSPPHPLHVVVDSVMVLLAGRIAEEVLLGGVGPPEMYQHDSDCVRNLVERICFDAEEQDAFLEWVTLSTRRCVYAWKAQIDAVASALLERGTLDGSDVRAAMFQRRTLRTVAH